MQVRRLRVHDGGPGRDVFASARRLQVVLDAAEPSAGTLPREAILCLRSLSDPMPRTLRLYQREPRSEARWIGGVSSALISAGRRAARPASGHLPDEAEAVLFTDRAQLLACLAQDVAGGRARRRWWWHALFRGAAPEAALSTSFRDDPEILPLVLERLAISGRAHAYLETVRDPEARTMTGLVMRTFGLAALHAALQGEWAHNAGVQAASNWQSCEATPAGVMSPPWRSLTGEASAILSRPTLELLLGLSIMVRRAPDIARSAAFAARTARWWRVVAGPDANATRLETRDPTVSRFPPNESLPAPLSALASPMMSPDARLPQDAAVVAVAADEWRSPAREMIADAAARAERVSSLPVAPKEVAPRAPSSVPLDEATAASEQTEARRVRSSSQRAPDFGASTPDGFGRALATRHGGLFLLANVALSLELYGDFTNPLRLGIALPFWTFMAEIGRRLAGQETDSDVDDPVWALFAALSGPTAELLSDDETFGPRSWHVSPSWMAAFPETVAHRWRLGAHHLALEHPAGFAVTEVLRSSAPDIPAASRASRWLDHLARYLRARLRRALGLTPAADLAPFLARPATVETSDTRVDVTFALDDHPLAIRLAGLDRDPGWIPAAGRDLRFHFT